ncbi:hypothetical protein [Dyella koreensis]|uniref:MAPEG family protein n=1 Tax=Dyella koreensis TaxID=311235 RepID=A0ABW8KCQ0_9GAMM
MSGVIMGAKSMSSMVVITLCVAFDLGFALFHLAFWRWLKWPQSLKGSGTLNQSITQTLNLMLSYVLVVYGVSLCASTHNVQSLLALSGAGFWLLRSMAQPALFLRTRLSWAMTVLFAVGAILHGAAWVLTRVPGNSA